MDDNGDEYCPQLHRAIELIGRRWTGAIIQAMLCGRTRFTDIRETVPGLSDRLLSERLKELEESGLVERCSASRDVEYHLSELGKGLEPVMGSIGVWARQLSENSGTATS